ncbi:hypothetical protein [Kitasatospora sp. NPDC059803]|uniref:hypothetical protein n=1 Tax=Kitasatospora sp. NPDC059803 TaxID=3346953 RepID=UPI00365EC0A7
MPEDLGLAALQALLGEAAETGPFLHDRDSRLVYALIDLQGGIGWSERCPGVRLLSVGAHLAAPSPELEWLNTSVVWAHMPPTPEPTSPARLAAALDAVTTPDRSAA